MDFINDEKQYETSEMKWHTLKHNGVVFPEEYKPHHVPILYNKEIIKLNSEEEEVATFYAKYLDTDYVLKKNFNENFFNDFRDILRKELKEKITQFNKIDFTKIKKYLNKEKEQKKKNRGQQLEKQKRKKEKYGFAIIDGKKQKIGNYMIEPPGLFLGRGTHPKSGKIKKRIYPEDVKINIGENEQIPNTNVPNHTKWGEILHNHYVMWLASWKDTITGGIKYMWLSSDSNFKSQSDLKKFERARKLSKIIKKIRKQYEKNWKSDNIKLKQGKFYFILFLSHSLLWYIILFKAIFLNPICF